MKAYDLLDTVLAKIRQLPGVLHVLTRPARLLGRRLDGPDR